VLAAARAAGLLACYARHHWWRPGDYQTWHYTAPTQESVAKNQVFAADAWGAAAITGLPSSPTPTHDQPDDVTRQRLNNSTRSNLW
jgi:ureidoacrylate peracid hydrolase